jgi:hypothetical protein
MKEALTEGVPEGALEDAAADDAADGEADDVIRADEDTDTVKLDIFSTHRVNTLFSGVPFCFFDTSLLVCFSDSSSSFSCYDISRHQCSDCGRRLGR